MTDDQQAGNQHPDDRRIELSVEVPGTPEEVWDVIATGPGISSWFVPATVEERVGGKVTWDFGSLGSESGQVEVWDPPERLLLADPGGQGLAYEWLVETASGDSCIVRLVNSGFGPGNDWDDDITGMREGWKAFLQLLRIQLTHFRGRRAVDVAVPTLQLAGPRSAAWRSLCDGLGIRHDAAVGSAIVTAGDAPLLGGTIVGEVVAPVATGYLVLLDRPAPGTGFIIVEGTGEQVLGSIYLYVYEPVDGFQEQWLTWLRGAAPAVAGSGEQP